VTTAAFAHEEKLPLTRISVLAEKVLPSEKLVLVQITPSVGNVYLADWTQVAGTMIVEKPQTFAS
jgi:hypothetical protein